MSVTAKFYMKHAPKNQGVIESLIFECEDNIMRCEKEITLLVGMNHSPNVGDITEEKVNELTGILERLFENLEENHIKKTKLEIILENMKYCEQDNEWEEEL